MLVVSDSSPLIVLINIGHIGLLPKLYDRIVIPPVILQELLKATRPEVVRLFATNPPAWLVIQSPQQVAFIPSLHAGETAAINLAEELGADLLLIDESCGRKAAEIRGLRYTGTIGILETAAEANLLDLASAFERIKRTDFWVSSAFLDEQLKLYLSRRKPKGPQ